MALKLHQCQLQLDTGTKVFSILALTPGKLPKEPFQTVGPVDEIKMAHTDQRSLVAAPLA